jgi:hypothetical protein
MLFATSFTSSFASSVLPTRAEAFLPNRNRLGTTGIHPEVGQLAIFTVSNP